MQFRLDSQQAFHRLNHRYNLLASPPSSLRDSHLAYLRRNHLESPRSSPLDFPVANPRESPRVNQLNNRHINLVTSRQISLPVILLHSHQESPRVCLLASQVVSLVASHQLSQVAAHLVSLHHSHLVCLLKNLLQVRRHSLLADQVVDLRAIRQLNLVDFLQSSPQFSRRAYPQQYRQDHQAAPLLPFHLRILLGSRQDSLLKNQPECPQGPRLARQLQFLVAIHLVVLQISLVGCQVGCRLGPPLRYLQGSLHQFQL